MPIELHSSVCPLSHVYLLRERPGLPFSDTLDPDLVTEGVGTRSRQLPGARVRPAGDPPDVLDPGTQHGPEQPRGRRPPNCAPRRPAGATLFLAPGKRKRLLSPRGRSCMMPPVPLRKGSGPV